MDLWGLPYGAIWESWRISTARSRFRSEVLIRGFDQTVIGNPAHDIIGLGLSLASTARDSDLSGVTTAKMLEESFNANLGRSVMKLNSL